MNNNFYEINIENLCIQNDVIYIKPIECAMSTRKLDGLKKIAMLQKYYQCNPVRFISDFFGIELLDYQAWIVQRSWTCPNTLIIATRGAGKSTIIDLMLMAKGMLFSNYWAYIASGSGNQAEQTFTTLERLANDNIDEMVGSTGYIFKNEVEVKNAAGDGFSHMPGCFTYNLYNGSTTKTLTTNVDAARGARGNVVFDESAFLSAELLKTYAAFAIVNKAFKTGKKDGKVLDPIRLRSIPEALPNQKFYISSASSTDMEYYKIFRDFAKMQLIGDPNYFVAHVDCEVAFAPTLHGEIIPPLLSRSTVESEMRTNPEKARREYYCEFTTGQSADAIVKRGTIVRNSETRAPLLFNDTNNKKFIISYDPARQRDNSVISVMELYLDENREYKGRLVACFNLIDVGKKRRSPMQIPDQVNYLRELILDYNGDAPDYENIEAIYIDAGAGGQALGISDLLLEDWVDGNGNKHRGLIDKEFSSEYVSRFPNAINKLKLLTPSTYKPLIYESLIEQINLGNVSFTSDYDNKDYLTTFEIDEDLYKKEKAKISERLKKEDLSEIEFNEKLEDELKKSSCIKTKTIKLDPYQKIALVNIDAMKEEVVHMTRKKRDSGKDSFELAPEVANKMHDDRSYTLALLCYGLSEKRAERIRNRKKPVMSDIIDKFDVTAAKPAYSIFR